MLKSNLLRHSKTENNRKIYLDYAAGVKANPNSIHLLGIKAKEKLQNAHRGVADVLNCHKEEIIFTSGGTESNNIAIQGVVLAFKEIKILGKKLPHIITTNIEHPSVLETFKLLDRRGLTEISIISVEENGIIDPKKIKKEIKANTILVSIMYANNEIGTIQPIREIAKEIRHYRKEFRNSTRPTKVRLSQNEGPTFAEYPVFHTDAVQAVNCLDLNIEKLGVDLLTLSGSKIEGAGRVGVLYKRKNTPLKNIFGGGDQELGIRPGTENLPEILKFSSALELAQRTKEKEVKRLIILRDYFFKKLLSFGFIANGDLKDRLPNNINVTFPKIPSDLLVIELSSKGIMVSSKSACKSSHKEGSYVIEALRKNSDIEIGGLRFSLGRNTAKKDIDYTTKVLAQILNKLKKWYK